MCSHFSLLFLSTKKSFNNFFIFLLSIYVWWLSIGPCSQSGMPNIDYAMINKLNLIKPMQIHICMWIYCGISFLWLISSITLLTSKHKFMQIPNLGTLLNQQSIQIILFVGVRYVNLRNANYFLSIWIFLTVTLSILDLGLGVAFGVDYDTLRVCMNRTKSWLNESYLIFYSSMRRIISGSMKAAVPISHNT